MASPYAATPATALCGKPAPIVDRFAGKIDPDVTLEALRAQYLAEVFALPADTAATIAGLAFGEGGER